MTNALQDRTGWVCARTEPHRELFAEANLRRTGLEVFCPRYQRWISSGRRRQLVSRPLFPSYLFARSEAGLAAMGHVKRTPGVSALAARDIASAIVPDALVAALRARQTADGFVEIAGQKFKAGERVRVSAGPFADIEAIFSEQCDETRARILLSLLGKQHRLVVPLNTLDRVA